MKIGLIFGEFNPPHIGHIMLAKAGLRMMDKVIFLPTFASFTNTPFFYRYNMVHELLSSYDYLDNKVEVTAINNIIPDDNPITALKYLDGVIDWTKHEYYIIVTDKAYENCKSNLNANIKPFVVHFYGHKFTKNCNIETWIDCINIESRMLRDFIKNKKSPYPYITKPVYEYIRKHKLYS